MVDLSLVAFALVELDPSRPDSLLCARITASDDHLRLEALLRIDELVVRRVLADRNAVVVVA